MPSVSLLKTTKIGKSLHTLAARSIHEEVRILAKAIEQEWKCAYRASVTCSTPETNHCEVTRPAIDSAGATPSKKPHIISSSDGAAATPSKKPRTINSSDGAGTSVQLGRVRVRKLLLDALHACHHAVLEKVSTAQDRIMLSEGCSLDIKSPDILASDIEEVLHRCSQSEKEYRAQARSIAFNLKDEKNAAFRLKLLLGHIEPDQMAKLTAEDMASDATRSLRERIRYESMKAVDIETNGKTDGSAKGMFECEKCQSGDTISFQIPSGKPDTAPTIVVVCAACGYRSNIQDKEC
jgi:transcription elongation factor S-II